MTPAAGGGLPGGLWVLSGSWAVGTISLGMFQRQPPGRAARILLGTYFRGVTDALANNLLYTISIENNPKFLQKRASVTPHPGQPLRQWKTLGGSVQGPECAGPAGQRPALGAARGQTPKRCGFCNCHKKFRELHHCVGHGPLFATWGGNGMFGQGLLMGDETLGGRKAKNACKGAPGEGLLAARSPIPGTWPPTSPPRVRLCRSWPGRAPRKGRKTLALVGAGTGHR